MLLVDCACPLKRSSTFRRGAAKDGPPLLPCVQPSFSLMQCRLVVAGAHLCARVQVPPFLPSLYFLLLFLPQLRQPACASRSTVLPLGFTFLSVSSLFFILLVAPAVLFEVYLVNFIFCVYRQHGLAAACVIVSLGTAVGPILALRGAKHGILLLLGDNKANAETRTCEHRPMEGR